MGSKPINIPIVNCAKTIHSLAADARTLHNGFDNIQRQFLRLPDPPKPPRLTQDWRVHTEDYRAILLSSDTYATNLTSIIDIYLALQGDITEEDTDDMIEELSTLRKDVEKPPPDMSKSCMELKRRIEECLTSTTSAVSTITGAEISSDVPSSTYDPNPHVESGPKKSALSCESKRRVSPDCPDRSTRAIEVQPFSMSGWIYTCLCRAWSIACAAFPLGKLDGRDPQDQCSVRTDPSVPNLATSRGPAAISAVDADKTPCAPELSDLRKTETCAGTQHFIVESAHYDPALLQSITCVVASLEKQAQQFEVFSEVTKHLENELNAYLSAFQALKTYRTPEKRIALQNMHARVAASARLWKELSSVLMDGYARIRK